MSLLSYNQLCKLIEDGVIENAVDENLNAASLDVRLGDEIMVEVPYDNRKPLDLKAREVLPMRKVKMTEGGYVLQPGEFVLAHTIEKFNLPNNVVAEYKLKSSHARNGLGHQLAGYCDPGWHGSSLTLEFKNWSQHTPLLLRPGMPCGQMIFFSVEEVPVERSYKTIGRYNNDNSVQVAKL